MSNVRCHLRLAVVASVAIAGMVLTASSASASPTNPGSQTGSRACCLKRSCTVCCCGTSNTQSPGQSATSPALQSRKSLAIALPPSIPCECRSNTPATPAPKPESRSEEQRSDRDRADSSLPASFVSSPSMFTFVRLTVSGPPPAPLYLRTARLLI
jgi:hypothetical protein